MRQYLGDLLYLGLLTCALMYVRDSFIEYMSGRTYYTIAQDLITMHDIPRVTLCSGRYNESVFVGEYGESFMIHVTDYLNHHYMKPGVTLLNNDTVRYGSYGLKVTNMSFTGQFVVDHDTFKVEHRGEYTCK